jgi:hypothetical protein
MYYDTPTCYFRMIQLDCSSLEEIDAAWRLLAHVPDEALPLVEVFLDGVFRYTVIRDDGVQTTARPADPPG